MDYSKGYRAIFYATVFDPVTWTDSSAGRIELLSGSVNRTNSELRNSASLTVKDYDSALDRWLRIYMVSEQLGEQKRVPLFTGLATNPNEDHNGSVANMSLQCYSVLKPAQDIQLEHGWFVAKNYNGVKAIKELLSCTKAPIVETEEGIAALDDYIIAEDQETHLSMVEKILDAIDWIMKIAGDGTIILSPAPILGYTEPVLTMSPNENDIVETSFSIEHDWFECPNVLRVTYNELTAIAKDEDPESPLSIQNRGREIWATESSPALGTDETLGEYTRARLAELQEIYETASYQRRFMPDVYTGDVIRLGYPDLNGDFIIESQSINLGHAATTSETVKRSA